MDCSPPGSSVRGIVQARISQFSRSVMSDSLGPHGLQHARLPCPSPTPAYSNLLSNSCPSSRWCHPTISSSVVPFSSRLQSFPASGSFQMSQFFTSGGQTIGVSASASVLPMNIQDWSPLGLTCCTSLQCKGPSRVFSNTTVQKHQIFGAQARILDCVAISFFRDLPDPGIKPGSPTLQADSLPSEPQGKPYRVPNAYQSRFNPEKKTRD